MKLWVGAKTSLVKGDAVTATLHFQVTVSGVSVAKIAKKSIIELMNSKVHFAMREVCEDYVWGPPPKKIKKKLRGCVIAPGWPRGPAGLGGFVSEYWFYFLGCPLFACVARYS